MAGPAPGKAEVNMGGWIRGAHFPSGVTFTETAGPLAKWGTSASKNTSAVANTKFMQAYLETTATDAGSDSRGMYLRMYFSGATTGGGEALRVYSEIVGVTCGTVHGAHISLGMGESTTKGAVTGLGVAVRATLGLPDVAMASNGTYAAIQAEIYSFGAASDPGAVAELSFIRVVNGGNASGIADVDDDANLITITGGAIASGNMVQAETDETKFSHKIRCNVHGTTMYLMACAT